MLKKGPFPFNLPLLALAYLVANGISDSGQHHRGSVVLEGERRLCSHNGDE